MDERGGCSGSVEEEHRVFLLDLSRTIGVVRMGKIGQRLTLALHLSVCRHAIQTNDVVQNTMRLHTHLIYNSGDTVESAQIRRFRER